MKCEFCGTQLPDDALFCLRCGNKTAESPSSSDLHANNELAAAEASAQKAANGSETMQGAQPTAPLTTKKKKFPFAIKKPTKPFLSAAGEGILMLGVFFAFIFVFLIGYEVKVTQTILGLDDSSSLLPYLFQPYHYNILEYFGAQYSVFFNLPEGMSNAMIVQLIVCILHTIVAAATVVSVVVFSVIAGIRYAKSFKKESSGGKSFTEPALAAILSYIAGAAVLFSLSASSEEIYSQYLQISTDFRYDGATVAGTVLAVICAVIYFALFVASRENTVWNKQTVLKNIFRAVKFSMLLTAIFFVCKAPITIRSMSAEESVEATISFVGAISMVGSVSNMDFSVAHSATTVFSCAVGAVLQYVLFALLLIALRSTVGEVYGKKEKQPLPFAIALTVLSAAAMIVCFVAADFLRKFYAASLTSAQYQIAVGTLIAVFILTVINLVFTVADGIVEEKNEKSASLTSDNANG